MNRRISTLVLLAVTGLGTTHCSSPSAHGDETHFVCSADSDCKRFIPDGICEVHRCVQAPEGYPTLADGGIALSLPASDDPGPVADCTHGYASDAASFETTARRLPPTTQETNWPGTGRMEPVLNASGTVIAFGAQTHVVQDSTTSFVQGHLVRWAGDALTWLGQPERGVVFPQALSCDGSTLLGTTFFSPVGFRWRRDHSYEELPLYQQMLSTTGDAMFSFAQASDQTWTAVRYSDGAAPEVLFTLPQGRGVGIGRGGDAFVYGDDTDPFVKVGSAEPVAVTLTVEQGCASPMVHGVSAEGRAVLARVNCGLGGLRQLVWLEGGDTRMLPDHIFLQAVTFGSVAVGQYASTAEGAAGVYRGVVWDPKHGVRYLDELLAEHGVTVPKSVELRKVTDVSDDGRVFTGTCLDERDPNRANFFRAVLPAGVFD